MGVGTSSEKELWRPPGWRHIDNKSVTYDSIPFFIKNTALRFLQIVYGERPPGNYRYDNSEELTEIKIVDQYAFQLDASENKPAIVAIRGPISWGNIGLTHGMQTAQMRTSTTERTDLLRGSVGFSCISRVGLEAEQLASDVFNLFKYFKTTLMRFGFFTVESVNLGPEQLVEVEGEPKLFLVSVLMQCQVQDRWMLGPKSAAELRKVVLDGLTDREGEELL